jgi:starch-binding outer membrane protein, SusD/RagB family
MKKILYILIFAVTFGCGDFLEEVSQDKLVPEKTDHFAALLLQEFNAEYAMFRSVDYMTDNMVEKASASTNNKIGNKTTYTWQREIEINEEGVVNYNINEVWKKAYEDIAIANYVIELIDEAQGTQQQIDAVKGEAYFIRAFTYFNLLNLYGQPFNPGTATSDLGVPLRINVGIESTYSRNTVSDCYKQIESDLENARTLLEQSGEVNTVWHPSVEACNLLSSRISLYQEKWDDVITRASAVISAKSLEMLTSDHLFITATNPEILFSFHTTGPLYVVNTSNGTAESRYYKTSEELIKLYKKEDNRLKCFFVENQDAEGVSYQPVKYTKDYYTQLGYNNFRVAEAYLNRAEAYAQKGDVVNALADIKKLIQHRYSNTSAVIYPTAAADVLNFILLERRKELCFEDHHRWFDLRRMKNRPVIQHVFTLVGLDGVISGTETYRLLADDPNYTLPIPLLERENNALIRNNERYEKLPEVHSVSPF